MKNYYSKDQIETYNKKVKSIVPSVRDIYIKLAQAMVHNKGTAMNLENIEKLPTVDSTNKTKGITQDVYVLLEKGITTAFYNKNIKRWVIGRPFPVAYESEVFEHKFITKEHYIILTNWFNLVILGIEDFNQIMKWINS